MIIRTFFLPPILFNRQMEDSYQIQKRLISNVEAFSKKNKTHNHIALKQYDYGHIKFLPILILEFCVTRCTWERNHIANVRHTGHEKQQTLETETETGMRTSTVLASIEIPPHILHRNI